MNRRYIYVALLIFATLLFKTAVANSRPDQEAAELATLTFCVQRDSDTGRQVVLLKAMSELLPKYIESLKSPGNKDGYVAKSFLSWTQQFSAWQPNLANQLCNEAYVKTKQAFEANSLQSK